MANKVGFGITQLNLVSSGTPKIESQSSLNLNAVTVAISTNATVGGTLDVSGHAGIGSFTVAGVSTFSGITTQTTTLFANQFSVSGFSTFNNDVRLSGTNYDAIWDADEDRLEFRDGASAIFGTGNDLEIKHSGGNTTLKNITGKFQIAGNDIRIQNEGSSTDFIKINSTGSVVTGVLTATSFSAPDGGSLVSAKWTLGADGSSHYTFTGPGGLSNTTDPTIYLARGQTYEFENNSGGLHPFEIRVSDQGSAYNTGVTNNGASSGVIKFEVPFIAPNTLYYQCANHSGMIGTITVYPDRIV